MPFKLKYDFKQDKIFIEKWLDEDAQIDAAARAELRQSLPIEEELDILRSAVVALGADKLPSCYLTLIQVCEEKKARDKEELSAYKKDAVWPNTEKLNAATLTQLKKFADLIGLPYDAAAKKNDLRDIILAKLNDDIKRTTPSEMNP